MGGGHLQLHGNDIKEYGKEHCSSQHKFLQLVNIQTRKTVLDSVKNHQYHLFFSTCRPITLAFGKLI